jgi:tetratricopeptide (TPR) repeat protein
MPARAWTTEHRLQPVLLAAAILSALAVEAASPRISFTRTIPARYDLGKVQDLTVIYAVGDSDKVDTFVAVLVDQTNRGSALRARDATEKGLRFIGGQPDPKVIKRLRREYPADVYLGVNVFTCTTQAAEAERGVRDHDGTRVRRKRLWIDAVCTARIDVMDGADLKRLFSFTVRGEGTSPRVEEMSDEVRAVALEQAARYAAVDASESITPRVLRETIELDPKAPAFEEGMAMIEVERYDAARSVWEAALRRNPDSAPLHFNVGAVAEAVGDRDAASRHFEEARRLAPDEDLYQNEWRRFQRRPRKK